MTEEFEKQNQEFQELFTDTAIGLGINKECVSDFYLVWKDVTDGCVIVPLATTMLMTMMFLPEPLGEKEDD